MRCDHTLLANPTKRAHGCFSEPLGRKWLHHIVGGGHGECIDGIVVERRHEHDARHVVRANGADNAKAVEPGHLDIEIHEVGPLSADRLDGVLSVLALCHDVHVALFRQ